MTAAIPEDIAWTQKWREKAVEWAKQDGEARRMEKLEKIVLSEIVSRNEGSIAQREHDARASQLYRRHCMEMVEARTKANVMKAEMDGMEMSFEAWRTKQATRRAEMNIR